MASYNGCAAPCAKVAGHKRSKAEVPAAAGEQQFRASLPAGAKLQRVKGSIGRGSGIGERGCTKFWLYVSERSRDCIEWMAGIGRGEDTE